MNNDDMNDIFASWADLGRGASPTETTDESWNQMIVKISPEGQRRLRFIETTAYIATREGFTEQDRRELSRYIVLLGLLSDIGDKRPDWIQRFAAKVYREYCAGLLREQMFIKVLH